MVDMEASRPSSLPGPLTFRQSLQSDEYEFPYHWIAQRRGGACIPARTMEWALEYLRILQRVVDLTVMLQPRRVLDFGCGDGRVTGEVLRATMSTVVGVDMSPRAIAFARAFNLPFGDRASFREIDVATLDEHDFDVVLAVEVLEHIPLAHFDGVVDALWRRTAPSGVLVVSVPTTNRPVQEKHERHFTADTLAAALEPRFSIRTTEYVHSVRPPIRALSRLIANRYVTMVSRRLNQPVTALYERLDRSTSARDGAHLIAVCERNTRA